MPHREIQTLTFPLTSEATGFDKFTYNTLSFPQKWREIINDLKEVQKRIPEYQPKRVALHELIRAFFPQLFVVESSLWKNHWLYGDEEISTRNLRQLVNAWFWSNNRNALERYPYIADKVDEIIKEEKSKMNFFGNHRLL